MKDLLSLMVISLVVTSCSGSNPATSQSGAVRSSVFSDTAVTSFEQTGGVASNKTNLLDKVLNTANAIDGNIRCVEGAPVSFELDALGNTVQIDTTCNSKMDLSIRQGLLESMAGKRMLQYWAGGQNARPQGRVFTFNSIGSFWSTYDNIEAGSSPGCKDKLTFDQSTGTITIEHDSVNSSTASQTCLDSEFVGATANDYKKVLPFRFIDGTMQFGTGTNDFSEGDDLVKLCISTVGTTCD